MKHADFILVLGAFLYTYTACSEYASQLGFFGNAFRDTTSLACLQSAIGTFFVFCFFLEYAWMHVNWNMSVIFIDHVNSFVGILSFSEKLEYFRM